MGDALSHTSMMADILGGVLEVAANIAITAVATAAVVAATGITVATGGLGCVLLGAVVGTVVGLLMSKSGADKGLTNLCDSFSNALFPPTVQANILTGATDTLTNNLPAARAAGAISSHVAPARTRSQLSGYGRELLLPNVAPHGGYSHTRSRAQASGLGHLHEASTDASAVPGRGFG
jgi:hypothetical protein